MNAKILVFAICVEAIIYLFLQKRAIVDDWLVSE